MPESSASRLGTLLALPWLALVASGFAYAWRYEATPGHAATAVDWPQGTGLRRDAARPTVLAFVHPDCPCSRIGLVQLARLMGKHPDAGRLTVVIVGAPGLEGTLAKGPNVRLARAIPGATVVFDPQGAEARRFGATTSGQTFAFSPAGRELFRGGITVARGHYGPNPGLTSLAAVLEGRPPEVPSTSVFGCAMREEVR